MIDTIHSLYDKKMVTGDDSLFLLLGQDLLPEFHRWKSIHELITIASPIIANRLGTDHGPWTKDPLLKKWIEKGMVEIPQMDISATEIRQRLKKGLYCGHLLNKSVLTHIVRYNLYHD